MPRKYVAKEGVLKRIRPDTSTVSAAVNEVKAGGSFKGTAKKFGINVMTLKRLCRKGESTLPSYKNRQVFSESEEGELCVYLRQMANMYYGLTIVQLRKLAYSYAVANNKEYPKSWDKNEKAGQDWYKGFLERNQDLSLRTPEATSLARSSAFNRHTVSEFFLKLADVYKRYLFPPECVWSVDETGVTTVHKPSKVIAVKDVKQVGKITSAERGELVTVCGAVNASGGHIPPFFIFPRKNWQPRMLKGSPPGSDGTTHSSGWMTGPSFVKFLSHFSRFAQPSKNRMHLIIMDNHESHCSVQSLEYAKDNGIVLLTIPPHTSHKLQPLDRTVFGPLKSFYSQACSNWMLQFPGRTISIYEISELLGDAFPRAMAPTNIMNGFRVSGIWPINPNIFTDDEYMTSAVTDRSDPSVTEPATVPILPTCSEATTSTYTPPHYSPHEIMPIPKAMPRMLSSRGRKRGRCRILTDTPEKAEIELLYQKKLDKESDAQKKKKEKLEKARKPILETSSDEDIPSLPDSSGCSDFVSSSNEEDLEEEGNMRKEPALNDFVLVKFLTKKTEKLYIGKIIGIEPNATSLKASFLRRKGLSGRFSFPVVEDVSEIEHKDIVRILPMPSNIGTARTAGILKFGQKFDANVS